jgi:hypothetical protein
VIEPDLEKLDLEAREPVPLARLRASDSGRRVGPKAAAKLGELYFHYPEAGTAGLAIPSGCSASSWIGPWPGPDRAPMTGW